MSNKRFARINAARALIVPSLEHLQRRAHHAWHNTHMMYRDVEVGMILRQVAKEYGQDEADRLQIELDNAEVEYEAEC